QVDLVDHGVAPPRGGKVFVAVECGPLCQVCAHDYPFTAPEIIALTKWRWKMRNTTIVGAMISREPALSRTTSVEDWPTKFCRAPAIVRFVGSLMSTMACRNVFHVHR